MSTSKIPLSEMIQTLREELETAQENAKDSDLKFITESAEIELSVGVTKTEQGKGGLNFWVIELGGEYEKANSMIHKFKLKLKPKSENGEPLFTR